MPRPRSGKKSFPCSFSLTAEQRQWLNEPNYGGRAWKRNSSEKIRMLINDIMAMEQRGSLDLSLLVRKYAIKSLENQRTKIQREKEAWFNNLTSDVKRKMRYKIATFYDGWDAMYARDPDNPDDKHPSKYPLQTPEAAYHRKEMLAYDSAIASIDERIKELKAKFMEQTP